MTRQLDVLDTSATARGSQSVLGIRSAHPFGAAGPLRTSALADVDGARPARPGRLGSFAAAFSTIGSTGISNPGEQVRAWTMWLSVVNAVMLVALGLTVYAILR